jgi:hypothetical protein
MLLLLLLLAAGASAADETKEEWTRRMDEAQWNRGEGGPNPTIAPRRDPKSDAAKPRRPVTEQPPSSPEGISPTGDAAIDPASSQGKAASKATAMAKALTAGLSGASEGSFLPQAARAAGGPSDPSRPRTEKDLVAAEGPYNASFKAAGIRVGTGVDGRPQLLDAAGRPASAAQVAALKESIATEPRALMRRPDFYEVLPRRDFQALKGAFAAGEGAGDARFRHMALSEPSRDFVWKESCAQVSGQCNALAKEKSYDKGADVKPETLAEVWKDIQESADAGDSLWADYVKLQRETAEREAAAASRGARWGAGFAERLSALARGLGWNGGGESSLQAVSQGDRTRQAAVRRAAESPSARSGAPLAAIPAAMLSLRRGGWPAAAAAAGALLAVVAVLAALRRIRRSPRFSVKSP